MAQRKLRTRLGYTVFLTFGLLSAAPVALSADLGAAQKAIRLQQYQQALALYQTAAEDGNAEAQYQLANLYLQGKGAPKDVDLAQQWLEEATAQGHPSAQFGLAQLLLEQDPSRSRSLLQAAAEQGYSAAITQLQRGDPKTQLNAQASVEAQWFGAARSNDPETMQSLLQQGTHLHAVDPAGRNALFYAVQSGSADAVTWLIETGIDVNATDSLGLSPAQTALERKRPAILQALLDAGADQDQILPSGDNLLHYAIRLKRYELVPNLLQAGVEVNHANNEAWTPLDLAEYQNADKTAALLEKHGASHGDGWRQARTQQDMQLFASQLESSGALPLVTMAVVNSNVPLLEELLAQDPTLHRTVLADGSTPLVLAVKQNKPDVVKTLIKHNVDVSQVVYKGYTATHIAAQLGRQEILPLLLSAGANPLQRDVALRDAISAAIIEEQAAAVHLMLNRVLGVRTSDSEIESKIERDGIPINRYILLATQHRLPDVVDRLLPFSTPVAEVDQQNRNALWFAAKEGNADLITKLLRRGIAAKEADQQGRTPFLVAVDRGCLECARRLLHHSQVNHTTNTGNSALMLAANNSDGPMAAWLVQNQVALELRNQRGNTALMIAVNGNAVDIVRLLLDADASVTRKNKLGFSAIDLAKQVSPEMLELVKSKSVLGIF